MAFLYFFYKTIITQKLGKVKCFYWNIMCRLWNNTFCGEFYRLLDKKEKNDTIKAYRTVFTYILYVYMGKSGIFTVCLKKIRKEWQKYEMSKLRI